MYTPTFSRFRRHILVAVTSVFLSSCGGGEVANEADLSDNYLSSTMQHDDVLKEASLESRLASVPTVQAKPVVYQVFTRLFGNTNSTNKPWGTIDENGVGFT